MIQASSSGKATMSWRSTRGCCLWKVASMACARAAMIGSRPVSVLISVFMMALPRQRGREPRVQIVTAGLRGRGRGPRADHDARLHESLMQPLGQRGPADAPDAVEDRGEFGGALRAHVGERRPRFPEASH